MSQLVTNNGSSSHWYELGSNGSWTPAYEILGKNGKLRKTTIKDAREHGYCPSVTSILGILAKEGLVNWRIEQGILAALSLPRIEGEPLDLFAKRCVEDAEKQSEAARAKGTAIHAAAEEYAKDRAKVLGDLRPYMEAFYAWFDDNVEGVLGVEQIIGDAELGYAGRLDLHCVIKGDTVPTVIDLKTQGVKPGKKAIFYDEWPVQLVAYAHALTTDHTLNRQSIVIDTTAPGPVWCQQWPVEESQHDWEIFQLMHRLWCWKNSYHSGKE